jgi:hypothetical protein
VSCNGFGVCLTGCCVGRFVISLAGVNPLAGLDPGCLLCDEVLLDVPVFPAAAMGAAFFAPPKKPLLLGLLLGCGVFIFIVLMSQGMIKTIKNIKTGSNRAIMVIIMTRFELLGMLGLAETV